MKMIPSHSGTVQYHRIEFIIIYNEYHLRIHVWMAVINIKGLDWFSINPGIKLKSTFERLRGNTLQKISLPHRHYNVVPFWVVQCFQSFTIYHLKFSLLYQRNYSLSLPRGTHLLERRNDLFTGGTIFMVN